MKEEKEKKIAEDVIQYSRNRIYLEIRYLEQALFRLIPTEHNQIFFGSDGNALYYSRQYLLRQYLQSPDSVCMDYLHTVIHCLYQHPFTAKNRDPSYWNLASDIAVMDVMLALDKKWLNTFIPQECIAIIEEIQKSVTLMAASHISRYISMTLSENESICGYGLGELEQLFQRDDHSCWNYDRSYSDRSDPMEKADNCGDSGEKIR